MLWIIAWDGFTVAKVKTASLDHTLGTNFPADNNQLFYITALIFYVGHFNISFLCMFWKKKKINRLFMKSQDFFVANIQESIIVQSLSISRRAWKSNDNSRIHI